jgi:hypothetical protein
MNVTESEILSCLRENFRLAAQHCDALAVLPARGPTYTLLRAELKTVENCCRQVAWYREDTRWLRVGLMMAEAHKRAGGWLRTYPRTRTDNAAHPMFTRLAVNLRAGIDRVVELETKATGIAGLILPNVPRAPTVTQGRMVQVRKSAGGVIIPDGVAA